MFNEIKTSKLLTHLKAGAQKNIVCGPEREKYVDTTVTYFL